MREPSRPAVDLGEYLERSARQRNNAYDFPGLDTGQGSFKHVLGGELETLRCTFGSGAEPVGKLFVESDLALPLGVDRTTRLPDRPEHTQCGPSRWHRRSASSDPDPLASLARRVAGTPPA